MRKALDLTNKRFGRLFVVGRLPKQNGNVKWLCWCDCGQEKSVQTSSLTSGASQSCGCLRREVSAASLTKHGSKGSPTYLSWAGMKQRCADPNHVRFKDYGGRGITVCERWANSFEHFLEDMGERPAGRTLDRIDVNGNYEPGNCRWATATEQEANKRNKVAQ